MSDIYVKQYAPVTVQITEKCEIRITERRFECPHELEGLHVAELVVVVNPEPPKGSLEKESNAAF